MPDTENSQEMSVIQSQGRLQMPPWAMGILALFGVGGFSIGGFSIASSDDIDRALLLHERAPHDDAVDVSDFQDHVRDMETELAQQNFLLCQLVQAHDISAPQCR